MNYHVLFLLRCLLGISYVGLRLFRQYVLEYQFDKLILFEMTTTTGTVRVAFSGIALIAFNLIQLILSEFTFSLTKLCFLFLCVCTLGDTSPGCSSPCAFAPASLQRQCTSPGRVLEILWLCMF